MTLRAIVAFLLASSAAFGAGAAPGSARLINLSARAFAGSSSNVLTAGFTIGGGPKQVLLRGIGPTLASFGVSGVLPQAELMLFNSTSAVIASDSGWNSSLAPLFAQLGAFALPSGSADSALLEPLPVGTFTTEVLGPPPGNATGIGLAEIYDADTGSPPGRLINLSARAQVGPGPSVLVGGFVIAGSASETVLLRGIGPTLASFGVPGVLAQPTLTLYDAVGNPLETNSGWGGGAALAAVFGQVQAFPLPTGSADAAMMATLAPGDYSVQVSGPAGGTGDALVEIYEVPGSVLPAKKFHPGHYMMLDIGSTSAQQRSLIAQNAADPNIIGFQICYTWAQLETARGNYAGIAATIASDLAYVAQSGKQLVVQLQYKSQSLGDFPAYLQAESNALVLGPLGYYIPNLWDPTMEVRARFVALLQQIALACDGSPNLELVNLAESAVVDSTDTLPAASGYTPQGWVNALQAVAIAAGAAFRTTTFEEYINYISGDNANTLVATACVNAINAGCTFGGPDIDPSRNNIPSYASYAAYALTSPLGSAVQPMDYQMTGAFWYDSDHSQTTAHLFGFATSPRLHVDYIFWQNSFGNADWQNAKATIDANPWPWY